MQPLQISIVIPTCNRRARLLSLLQHLNGLNYPIEEVIIVDSGDDRLLPGDYADLANLTIQYLVTERSVCLQRNTGIQIARSPWIFLCDDDVEIPSDYLMILAGYIEKHPGAGAVSGLWLQLEGEKWIADYPVRSATQLFLKFIFLQGMWGTIDSVNDNIISKRIKRYYREKGNHISKAGWPVNTAFTGDTLVFPVYSLGAALVKSEWLIHSPYDEVLDSHGIGDNYGVAVDFPVMGVHVVTSARVYHHREPANRLTGALQYYRRVLALDYFIRVKKNLKHVKRFWLCWSLIGNLLSFIYARDKWMIKATLKSLRKILFNQNPYYNAGKQNKKVIEPLL